MNGAAVIAEILKREGTEFLSCYPRNPLIEASAAVDIRPILCRQERVGVGIADGYSRVKCGKRNGVFAAQAGPGIENAFPGVAQAFSENVPLLVIAGHAARAAICAAGFPRRQCFSAGDEMVSAGAFGAGIARFDAASLSRHAQWQGRSGPDRSAGRSLHGRISRPARLCTCSSAACGT